MGERESWQLSCYTGWDSGCIRQTSTPESSTAAEIDMVGALASWDRALCIPGAEPPPSFRLPKGRDQDHGEFLLHLLFDPVAQLTLNLKADREP